MALTRQQVVATAVGILTQYGLADLSMRRLARELDVQPSALYWHFASKQDLLVEVATSLLEAVPEPRQEVPPLEAVASVMTAMRAALAPVPDAAEVVGVAYAAEPASVGPCRWAGGLLARAGVAPESRGAVTDLLVHHVLGSVAIEQNERHLRADGEAGARTPADVAKSFEVGLGVILRGLA